MAPRLLHPPPYRGAACYLLWFAGHGYRSAHLDRVRAALTSEPQTRRQIADRAGVSYSFARTAAAVLVALGEAAELGHRGRHRALLYVRR